MNAVRSVVSFMYHFEEIFPEEEDDVMSPEIMIFLTGLSMVANTRPRSYQRILSVGAIAGVVLIWQHFKNSTTQRPPLPRLAASAPAA